MRGYLKDMADEPDNQRATSRERRDQLIVDQYQRNVPVATIAATAGVSVKTVRNVARRAGLPPRRRADPSRNAAIVALYRAGEPVVAITRTHEASGSHVRAVAARAGLPPRSGWQRRYRNGRAPRKAFFGTRQPTVQCEAFWRGRLGFSDPYPVAAPHGGGLWKFTLNCRKAVQAARVMLASSPTSMKRKRALLEEVAQGAG
jgi:hypothetical protein